MGWIIFGGIVLLISGILSLSLVFAVQYEDELLLSAQIGPIKYGIMVTDEEKLAREARKKAKEARKKKPAKAKKKGNASKKAKQPKKEPERGNVSETFHIVWDLIRSVSKPLPFLLRHVRITQLSVQIAVAGEDAAETALNYGKLSGVVYGSLSALKSMFRVHVKKINLCCDFCADHTKQVISFRVKIRLAALMFAALRMGVHFIAHTYHRVTSKTKACASN